METNSVFLRSRVDDPAQRAALARRVAELLQGTLERCEHSAFDDWMTWLDRLMRQALPVASVRAQGGWEGPEDVPLTLFLEEVVHESRLREIASPDVLLRSWSNFKRIHRTASDRTARLWVAMASDASYSRDASWINDLVDSMVSRVSCECCDGLFFYSDMATAYGGNLVCESCRDEHYTYSERYGDWVANDGAVDARDERGRRCVIHTDDPSFHWDEDAETYVHEDYRPASIIGDYHSSKAHQVLQSDDWTAAHNGRHLGVELEVESTGARDRVEIANALHREINGGLFGRRVFFERDGSLHDGFEIISQPMSLPALRDLFGFLRDPSLVRGLRSHRTSTCGLHIHVSREGLNNITIARAVTFVHAPENDAFLTALARRYNTQYCRYLEKDLENAAYPGDRYEAVNLTGRHTIEFRVFRGSLKYEAVIAAAEFCHALLEYCARPDLEPAGLNAAAFVNWCAREHASQTAILRDYVAQRAGGLFQHSEAA
jgi:hypothetical protein